MIKPIVLLAITALVASCGAKLNKTRGLDITYQDSSTGEPIELQESKILSVCKPSADDFITASIFNGKEFQNIPYKLNTELVPTIYYGGKIDLIQSSIGLRGFRKNIINNGKAFTACKGTDYSTESSYQSATASTLLSFSKIQRKLKNLNINLVPLTLRIAPIITRTNEYTEDNKVVRKSHTQINNAYYSSRDKEITFLPQGIPNRGGIIPFSGVPMWKIPFVSVHEYGHHLFASFFPNYVEDTQVNANTKLCFDNSHAHDNKIQLMTKTNSNDRKIGLKDVVTVINEGISDMFARYIVDENINMKNLGCLNKSRNVESSVFKNGASKRLTKNQTKRFFLTKSVKVQNCYREVDYQDPHMIGASIAFMFDQILSENKQSKNQKILFLIEWIKDLNNKYYTYKFLKNEAILETMTLIGLDIAKSKFDISQSKICAIVGMNYPSLHSYYSCK
jgi:hypothetical protein